mmetsp:Transcript_90822/g.236603  ORF Transcript_90822/g.236603 Transcript_90822/m.236603 type:complete len:315 (-) Transcript_90822:364-1308(-)
MRHRGVQQPRHPGPWIHILAPAVHEPGGDQAGRAGRQATDQGRLADDREGPPRQAHPGPCPHEQRVPQVGGRVRDAGDHQRASAGGSPRGRGVRRGGPPGAAARGAGGAGARPPARQRRRRSLRWWRWRWRPPRPARGRRGAGGCRGAGDTEDAGAEPVAAWAGRQERLRRHVRAGEGAGPAPAEDDLLQLVPRSAERLRHPGEQEYLWHRQGRQPPGAGHRARDERGGGPPDGGRPEPQRHRADQPALPAGGHQEFPGHFLFQRAVRLVRGSRGEWRNRARPVHRDMAEGRGSWPAHHHHQRGQADQRRDRAK